MIVEKEKSFKIPSMHFVSLTKEDVNDKHDMGDISWSKI